VRLSLSSCSYRMACIIGSHLFSSCLLLSSDSLDTNINIDLVKPHLIGKSIWELCCSEGSRHWTWYLCEGISGTKKLYAEYGIAFYNWVGISFYFCSTWHCIHYVISYILSKRNSLYVFLFEQYSWKDWRETVLRTSFRVCLFEFLWSKDFFNKNIR